MDTVLISVHGDSIFVCQIEPLVRLNVESRGDIDLMKSKTEEVLNLIEDLG